MIRNYKIILRYFFIFTISSFIIINGCIAPPRKDKPKEEEEYEEDESLSDSSDYFMNFNEADSKLSNGDLIFKYAFREQRKSMYSKNSESVYLYWLKNKKLYLKGKTKCNIFAINTLYKAGFLCPKQNARTVDLMNKKLFNDELPIIRVSKPSHIEKGDLIVWNGHVIIYDTVTIVNKKLYAKAIWAGTSKKDNGKNIRNNVIYGKYPLSGNFIVRRPVRK